MQTKQIAAVILLATLPLLAQPVLAVDKATTKQATATVMDSKSAASDMVSASGKVNINTATLAELTDLKGIGDKKAQAIIDYRDKQGKFTSIDQLAEVSGIGPATVEANRDMISLK